MATIPKANIQPGNIIQAADLLNVIGVLDGTINSTTIILSGSVVLPTGAAKGSYITTADNSGTMQWASAPVNLPSGSSRGYLPVFDLNSGIINSQIFQTYQPVGGLSYFQTLGGLRFGVNCIPLTGQFEVGGSIYNQNNQAFGSRNAAGTAGAILFMSASNIVTLYDQAGIGSGIDIVETNACPIRFATSNAYRMYIAANGNVGIATSAPSYGLDANTNVRVTGNLIVTGSVVFANGASKGAVLTASDTAGTLTYATNVPNLPSGSSRGYMPVFDLNNGIINSQIFQTYQPVGGLSYFQTLGGYRFGINCIPSTGQLEVNGSIYNQNNQAFGSRNSGGTAGAILYMSSGNIVTLYDQAGVGSGIDIVETNASPVRIFTNNIARVYVSPSGSVGIGGGFTDSNKPSYTLDVNGNERVTGNLIITGSVTMNSLVTLSRTPVVASPYNILITSSYIGVTNMGFAPTLTLPSVLTVPAGTIYIIKDEGGEANTYNVTISGSVGNSVDTMANATQITTNFGSVRLISNGTTGWFTW
jgi:hypothetical protein